MRLRPRQHLVDGERLRELLVVEPAELVHALAPDHRDLRRGAAPREQAEAQEPQEDVAGRLAHRTERRRTLPTFALPPSLGTRSCDARPAARRPLPPPHRAPGRRRAARDRAGAVDRLGLDARPHVGLRRALPRARARARRALPAAARHAAARGRRRGDLPAARSRFVALLAALLVPPLVDEVDGLADAAPGYVEDITAGRGPLGFLADGLPRRRPRPRGDRVRRRLAARRRRGHGASTSAAA